MHACMYLYKTYIYTYACMNKGMLFIIKNVCMCMCVISYVYECIHEIKFVPLYRCMCQYVEYYFIVCDL